MCFQCLMGVNRELRRSASTWICIVTSTLNQKAGNGSLSGILHRWPWVRDTDFGRVTSTCMTLRTLDIKILRIWELLWNLTNPKSGWNLIFLWTISRNSSNPKQSSFKPLETGSSQKLCIKSKLARQAQFENQNSKSEIMQPLGLKHPYTVQGDAGMSVEQLHQSRVDVRAKSFQRTIWDSALGILCGIWIMATDDLTHPCLFFFDKTSFW